jgi:hypothetical protein
MSNSFFLVLEDLRFFEIGNKAQDGGDAERIPTKCQRALYFARRDEV